MVAPRRGKQGIGLWIAVIWLGWSSCSPVAEQVPDHLVGIWKTSVSTHADSTMEFTKELVIFKGKSGEAVAGRIVEFAQLQDRSTVYYRLSYLDPDHHRYQLDFVYDPANGGSVTFKNQPNLTWKRTGARV